MLGPRINQVFRSRWLTLWWAACMLLTAYCSVPSVDDTQTVPPAQVEVHKHVNPWAKDPK